MTDSPSTSSESPSIQQIFASKCVFITGVTGFVGKVLLEKLLRSCPDISTVLVLIRSNEKYTSEERLQKLLQSSVFDRIKSECPMVLNKIKEIDGDVTEKNLKLNPQELDRLYMEVDFVFHCAASVRFENDARDTLKINLFGVKNVMTVCQKMQKLMAVVHVSTAYSFCNKELIDEVVYDEVLDLYELEEAVRIMESTKLREFSDKMSHTRPSLYQYSKALAEVCIKKYFNKLPVIIVRPSIVTASVMEPKKGWIDNYNGPSGFIALSLKGILKTLLVKPGIKADWVPVDVVANTLILSAYYVVLERLHKDTILNPLLKPSGVTVINCVSPSTNSITWSEIVELCIPLLNKYPSLDVCRLPGGSVTSSPSLYKIYTYIYHYFPAIIMDLAMMLLRKEPRFVNNYIRIHKVLDFLQLYTMNEFSFKSMNMVRLHTFCEDRQTFPIYLNTLEWREYIRDYVLGVRFFFLKESDDTLPQAQKKLIRLQRIFLFSKIVSLGLVLTFLLRHKQRIGMTSSSFPFCVIKNVLKSSSKFITVNVLKL